MNLPQSVLDQLDQLAKEGRVTEGKKAVLPGLLPEALPLEHPMTVKQFMAKVIDLAHTHGWMAHSRLPEAASQNLIIPAVAPKPIALGEELVGVSICEELVLTGEPVCKARPRFVQDRVITQKKTKDAEEAIRLQLRMAGVVPDADHLLRVDVRFRAATGQRKDLDNMVKLVLDACNGFAWRDDVQVSELHAYISRRDEDPGTSLSVRRIGRYTSDCLRCGKVLEIKPGGSAGRKGYCSRECYDEAQRSGNMVACPECGKAIYRQLNEESKALFCSKDCSYAHKAGSRRPSSDDSGYPSLTLVGNRVVFMELKVHPNVPTAEQRAWHDALKAAKAEVYVFYPEHWPIIARILEGVS